MTGNQSLMNDDEFRALLHNRLGSIETKLSELQTVMITLARVEERLSNNLDGMHRLGKRVDEHEERIADLEYQVNNNSRVSRAVERVGWMFVTMVFSVFGFMAKDLIDHVDEAREPKTPTKQAVIYTTREDITDNLITGEES